MAAGINASTPGQGAELESRSMAWHSPKQEVGDVIFRDEETSQLLMVSVRVVGIQHL